MRPKGSRVAAHMSSKHMRQRQITEGIHKTRYPSQQNCRPKVFHKSCVPPPGPSCDRGNRVVRCGISASASKLGVLLACRFPDLNLVIDLSDVLNTFGDL